MDDTTAAATTSTSENMIVVIASITSKKNTWDNKVIQNKLYFGMIYSTFVNCHVKSV